MTKGIPVYIDKRGVIFVEKELYRNEQINGQAFTKQALREFAEKVAREAYLKAVSDLSCDVNDEIRLDIVYFFASPEFKKLLG